MIVGHLAEVLFCDMTYRHRINKLCPNKCGTQLQSIETYFMLKEIGIWLYSVSHKSRVIDRCYLSKY